MEYRENFEVLEDGAVMAIPVLQSAKEGPAGVLKTEQAAQVARPPPPPPVLAGGLIRCQFVSISPVPIAAPLRVRVIYGVGGGGGGFGAHTTAIYKRSR
jgi:hypothetical protein